MYQIHMVALDRVIEIFKNILVNEFIVKFQYTIIHIFLRYGNSISSVQLG